MNKQEAIREIKYVQGGQGVNRAEVLNVIGRGRTAESLWNDGTFTLGFEYGYILGLIKVFNITREEFEGDDHVNGVKY